MLQTYTLEITPTWNITDDALLSFVSAERQQKVKKYVFDVDKKLSLYAALLTRMQLSLFTQTPSNQLSFSCSENNKPYISSMRDCHFNFSHTKNRILLAISSLPVGADIEIISNAPLDVMDLVFHPDEIDYISSASSPNEKTQRFFTLWTRKEALTKYLGIGLVKQPASINTFSDLYCSHFHTWNENHYICSIYNETSSKLAHTTVTEKDIYSFFLISTTGLAGNVVNLRM